MLIFLLALTLIVCVRAAASAHGATPDGLSDRVRVALFDPDGRAAPALRALGLAPRIVSAPEELTLFEGDLIVVGPGGFSRGRENLGPVLAARLRGGLPVLLLDQPSLPPTLSEELRLWPAFIGTPGEEILVSSRHPVMQGLPEGAATAYLAGTRDRTRPLLPPTRGNFRVLAEVRARSGTAWQEAVSILEVQIGEGTLLAAQASLCADFASDPRARTILRNALLYLIGERAPRPRAALYGGGPESLPACLRHLAPYLPMAPDDLRGVELLIAPADWQALRLSGAGTRPPLARVARFLREGGTLVLLNPQSLVIDPIAALTGTAVSFETGNGPVRPAAADLASLPLFQGVSRDDLSLLEQSDRPELRLRPPAGALDAVEALQIEPGLARYRVGRGTLVALMLPDAARCSSAPVSSLLARLLTNLGVPLDAETGQDRRAITRLDEPGE